MLFGRSVSTVLLPAWSGILLMVWGSIALAAPAKTPEEVCASLPPARAQVVADWARPAQEIKPLSRPEGDAPVLAGSKYMLTLLPYEDVKLVMPEKPIHLLKYAGLLSFTVDKSGLYRFSTAPYVWLELVPADGSGKEPGVRGSEIRLLACSSIKKNVVFELEPGRYWLQMSGSLEADVQLMISAPE
mgnify:CR=1 FL=1